ASSGPMAWRRSGLQYRKTQPFQEHGRAQRHRGIAARERLLASGRLQVRTASRLAGERHGPAD
ncbi:MAG: hypothetical protein WBC62_06900, partial [Candidatus Macondimonas sp.]